MCSALAKSHESCRAKDHATEFKPTNIPYVFEAALLWFGWFGFNAGSALAANNWRASGCHHKLGAAASAVSWMIMDWVIKGKPSAVGIAVGAVVGLVAITPCAGFVSVSSAIIIGLIAGVISNLVANWRVGRSRIDDTLDVFACHGVGGIWGSIAVGLFASVGVNGLSLKPRSVGCPADSSCSSGTFSFVGSYVLLKVVNKFSPLRVSPEEEDAGLDLSEHGEEAYQLD